MNRQQIKLLAITAMTIDHIALVFVPSGSILYYVMRLIGRLTAPLMAFMLTERFRYTHSRLKYLLRLFAFALISQPFYFRMLFGRAPTSVLEYLTHWNVMFSLAVALLSLMLLESKISAAPRLILVGVCISLAQFGDWLYMIPVWVIIFYVFRDDRKKRTMIFMLATLAMIHILMLSNTESALTFSYQYGTLLALLPIRLYNERGSGKQSVASKWLYYIYYPLHMALLTMQN
jgi:hypothetical protein